MECIVSNTTPYTIYARLISQKALLTPTSITVRGIISKRPSGASPLQKPGMQNCEFGKPGAIAYHPLVLNVHRAALSNLTTWNSQGITYSTICRAAITGAAKSSYDIR